MFIINSPGSNPSVPKAWNNDDHPPKGNWLWKNWLPLHHKANILILIESPLPLQIKVNNGYSHLITAEYKDQ